MGKYIAKNAKMGLFVRLRNSVSGCFKTSEKKNDARMKRGAELFAEKYSKTMEMLAKESKTN